MAVVVQTGNRKGNYDRKYCDEEQTLADSIYLYFF